jgi:hypothetical protein
VSAEPQRKARSCRALALARSPSARKRL